MPVPRWLDRLWLICIGLAFCLMVPIWIIEWGHDIGFLNLGLGFLVLVLVGVYRRVA